jgi:hypothetical protein
VKSEDASIRAAMIQVLAETRAVEPLKVATFEC